ncbi:MAG: HK97 family phage prohead protease [Alphaproteobacteria bacterium]|nr:HK97 family phage prohead protease [Alphaproteobacteria bacterium]
MQPKGLIAGYASCFDKIDQQRDVITKGAFSKTLRAWHLSGKKPKMLWQHKFHQPIGVWTHLLQDEYGLYVEGRLALGTTQADEAYLFLKFGVLDGLSIGFRTIKAVRDVHRKARIILDIDLIEISLVTFGANPNATVRQVKAREQ